MALMRVNRITSYNVCYTKLLRISMLEKAKEDRRFLLGSLHALGQIRFDMEDYSGAIEYLERGLNNLKRNDEESLAYRYLLAECFELERNNFV